MHEMSYNANRRESSPATSQAYRLQSCKCTSIGTCLLGTADNCVLLVLQSSLTSEMRNMSFTHMDQFHHHNFLDTHHDFQGNHPQEFLSAVAHDMANEASDPAFAMKYIASHQNALWDAKVECADENYQGSRRRLRRKKDRRVLPKHFYIDDWHRSDYDRGALTP